MNNSYQTNRGKIPCSLGIIYSLFLLLQACSGNPAPSGDPLDDILSTDDALLQRVLQDPDSYELQIRYTRIERKGDSVAFQEYAYRVSDSNYFYPASTVKFPISVLALEKLNSLPEYNRKMDFYYEGDSVQRSFEGDIEEIFAVSDNHASNRLFEFLGQDAINEGLTRRGVAPVRIAHRLGFRWEEMTTRPIIIAVADSVSTQLLPIGNAPIQPLDLRGSLKGKGFMAGDSLRTEPFDFRLKNYLPLNSLHGTLQRVIFPEKFPVSQRFALSEDQREFLMEAMRITPRELGYDPETYPDGYCKFFIFGDSEEQIPASVNIYNKVGFAYGTLTDVAYIQDLENEVEFMLSATLLVNENGIFNDNTYEFDTVGIPFLAALGRAVYNYELAHPQSD
ncbi:Beta-lactamase enzyme family protein [Robiginitalea myxolifaciens]|uniref:Beta-lactamase enzyme family protein n=1 Tax=Robiginitalea myxolifaciens TaxID=400055 RepID=A0A1I6H6F3_9FLAO|nr:serine hydrolase [Robiginitalea myxolifaciens]SFR50018.1 Beta-lactamase enzyme family protein [Robiginitalea myxolifaciens]